MCVQGKIVYEMISECPVSIDRGCIVCVQGKIVYEMIGECPACRQRLYCVCSG